MHIHVHIHANIINLPRYLTISSFSSFFLDEQLEVGDTARGVDSEKAEDAKPSQVILHIRCVTIFWGLLKVFL